MEIWKTIDGFDGVFSISNKKRIHQSEYYTTGKLWGKEVPEKVPEKYYAGDIITVKYKNQPIMLVMDDEIKKYFDEEEIKEGKETKENTECKGLEKEFAIEVDSRGISKEIPRDIKIASLEGETWLPVRNFKDYEVSDEGRVKHLANVNQNGVFYHEYIVKPTLNDSSKLTVNLWSYPIGYVEKEVDLLVAEHFLPNPKQFMCIKHLNGDEFDNRLENLQWYDNTPNCYYECTKTGEKYVLTDACVQFNMSPEEFLFNIKYGKEINGHVFVEKKMKIHSSNGNIGKCIIAKDATREPIKMVRKYVKNANTVSNPNKTNGKTFIPPTSEMPLKNVTVIDSFKEDVSTKRVVGERIKDIPDFKDYLVSSTGNIIRKTCFINGIMQKERTEIPYEKNGLMWVKLINSTGVHEKIVERIVANAFVYNKDYFIITHKDNDFKNNDSSNLIFEKTEDIQLNDITLKELSEKVNLSKFEIYTMILEGSKVYGENYMIVEQEKKVVNRQKTEIICVETGKIFPSMTAVAKEMGVDTSWISKSIKRNIKVKQYTFKRVTDNLEKEKEMTEVIWKPYPQWEQYLQINKDGDVKSLERHTNRRVYPEKIHKPALRKNGDRKVHLTINGQSVYLDINQALKDTFGSVEIWKLCSVPKTLVSNHYNAKSIGRGRDKLLTRYLKGNRLFAKRHVNGKYYSINLQKEVNALFTKEERVLPKEIQNNIKGVQLNLLNDKEDIKIENVQSVETKSVNTEVVSKDTNENTVTDSILLLETLLNQYDDYSTNKIKSEINNVISELKKITIPQGHYISDKEFEAWNTVKKVVTEV